jgi:hypothetical protein
MAEFTLRLSRRYHTLKTGEFLSMQIAPSVCFEQLGMKKQERPVTPGE